MNFRTSYLVGLTAAFLALSSQFVTPSVHGQDLKVTGPDGQSREQPRQYGPTSTKDTFWSIANQVRPDSSVSIYQVMAAIYDANPQAFTSNNYNSLEKGMYLLIPSKEVMLAIPRSLAQQRAEADDNAWKRHTSTSAHGAAPVAKSAPVAAVATPKKTTTKSLPALDVDNLQTENLKLTNELSQVKSQLTAAGVEKTQLQSQLEELQQRVTVLEASLKAARSQVEQLQSDLAAAKTVNENVAPAAPVAAKQDTPAVTDSAKAEATAENAEVASAPAPKPVAAKIAEAAVKQPQQPQVAQSEQPGTLWRTIMGNPLYLAVVALIPAGLLGFLGWFFFGRRKVSTAAPAAQGNLTAEDSIPSLNAHDDAADLDSEDISAIHLDEQNELDEQLKDLAQLQPEPKTLDEVSFTGDMPEHEMFIDEGSEKAEAEFSSDDAQSLDDLWAEAMGEQAEDTDTSLKDDDFESLLEGLEDTEESKPVSQEDISLADTLPEDVTAALEQEFGEQEVVTATDSFAETAEPEPEPEPEPEQEPEAKAKDNFVIDFEPDPAFAPKASAVDENAATALTKSTEEDLDAVIAAELGLDDDNEPEDTDVDALLAALETKPPIEPQSAPDDSLQDEIAAELAQDLAASDDDEQDADVLLAELERDAETEDDTDDLLKAAPTIAATVDEEETELSLEDELSKSTTARDDDLDALLAELSAVEKKKPVADSRRLKEKDAGFFDDLKAPKSAQEEEIEDYDLSLDAEPLDVSDDELLKRFAKEEPSLPEDDGYDLHFDDEQDSKLTVDEALAALDADEIAKRPLKSVSDADLSAFQKENGFIDIDKLLNDASDEPQESDPYKALDVDMGDLNALVNEQDLVDVDDEENSVNAKLDLARAYIEIDDRDAAMALLKEVQMDGNERQQEEAESLMKEIE
ncbi:hypothetical protein KDN34_07180 [Shewanella yunxiaonensis]|uniref:Pilus assembly protein FimV n=1 Tax=Shewanella yunxiaonensis TaxID=2829809 RepID=A0ABX7YWK5_9GAMM|nr:FimV/HubP family polar landmark protein [Shewanella yunxiaonensis]QUN07202.1 hypothetical protein KDN34_07180 [Shewanella yunxiaonensis]